MGDTFNITGKEFIKTLAAKCIGFHFASAKSLGKTTHAFVSKGGILSNKIHEAIKADKAIVDLSKTTKLPKAIVGLLTAVGNNAMENRVGKPDPSALLAPVLLNVKGSAVDSITTTCRLAGYMRLTTEFYACELEILSGMYRESSLIGSTHKQNTIAKRICNETGSSQGSRLGVRTLREFVVKFRLSHHLEFGVALASVFKALQVVRRGFLDSGKQFRDTSSRTMAANAYREALYNILNITF